MPDSQCGEIFSASFYEGFSFPGVAVFIHPSGNVMESYAGEEEKMIVAELKGKDLEEIRTHRMKYFLPYRRPKLYRDLYKS